MQVESKLRFSISASADNAWNSAVDLAGLDLRQNILRAVSRPQALCRLGHLAGVEAATLQAQGGYPCGQFRAKGFPGLAEALV